MAPFAALRVTTVWERRQLVAVAAGGAGGLSEFQMPRMMRHLPSFLATSVEILRLLLRFRGATRDIGFGRGGLSVELSNR
jgi:hypothetical protein